jgi:hypothetical protein
MWLLVTGWLVPDVSRESLGLINGWNIHGHFDHWRWDQHALSKRQHQSPSDAAPHSRRTETSCAPMWKPKTSQTLLIYLVAELLFTSEKNCTPWMWLCYFVLYLEKLLAAPTHKVQGLLKDMEGSSRGLMGRTFWGSYWIILKCKRV